MTERAEIRKERLYLMSPFAHIGAVAAFDRLVAPDALLAAIRGAVRQHQILCSRVTMREDGGAAFEPQGEPPLELLEWRGSAQEMVASQAGEPFTLERGETLRAYRRAAEGRTELLLVAHHIVCDGGSLMLLLGDILRCLNGQTVARRPIRLLTRRLLPKHPRLPVPMRLMMRATRARWRRSGRSFSWEERAEMQRRYADAHPVSYTVRRIDGARLSRLLSEAKARGVTVNSLLVAAVSAQWRTGESVGVAVGVRPEALDGMGNYAIGVSIKPNGGAEAIHRQIREKLQSPKELYFLYEFMDALPPTLVDAVYFARYGDYADPLAESVARMCGYTDAPANVSTTNLVVLGFGDDPEWRYRYQDVFFLPPYVPNARCVIGASTYRDTLTLTCATDEARGAEERARFDRLCEALGGDPQEP